MSFWKTFGFHTVSAIDTLLESGEYTLEQLLDEEDILQETKSQNKRLLDFLVEDETLKKLLYYICVEPDEDDDSKRKFKYPFLACEILASEVWAICDAMYQTDGLLDDLYSFFERDSPMNSLLSSYVSRVAGVLLQKKPTETIEYMKQRKDIVSQFLNHLGNASVMDLLLKVIACEDAAEGTSTLEWLCTTNLIPTLVQKFDPKNGQEIHENAAQALVDIIIVSTNSVSSPLIAQLESCEMINKLFSYMSEGVNSSMLQGLTVIIELLRRHVQEHHDDSTTLEELPEMLKIIVSQLEKFNQYLTTEDESGGSKFALPLPIGEIVPLGFHKLKIIEFFAALIITGYQCIDQEIIKHNLLHSCLKLFFHYPWNNFLHGVVLQIVQTVLEGENEELKLSLLKDAKLVDFICSAAKANEEECAKPKGVRRGYMGHITAMSTAIIQASTISLQLQNYLDEHQAWNKYVSETLTSTKERENRSIGNFTSAGRNDSSSDELQNEDDEDLDDLVNPDDANPYGTTHTTFNDPFADYVEGEDPDDYDDNSEEYNYGGENEWRLEADEDDDDDDEEEDGVVMQSHIEQVANDEDDEMRTDAATEVWIEREIEDVPEDNKGNVEKSDTQEETVSNHVSENQVESDV